jgi:hypothetical protein
MDLSRFQKELANKVDRVLDDMARLKAEMEDADHLAELCFLEGDIKDIKETMKDERPPNKPHCANG